MIELILIKICVTIELSLYLHYKFNNNISNMQRKSEIIEKFITFYESQDLDKKREIRNTFLEETMLSYPAWFSKMKRKSFSLLEMKFLYGLCGIDSSPWL